MKTTIFKINVNIEDVYDTVLIDAQRVEIVPVSHKIVDNRVIDAHEEFGEWQQKIEFQGPSIQPSVFKYTRIGITEVIGINHNLESA